MTRKITGAALAVLTATTTITLATPSAQAATQCAIGKWRLTKASGQVKGPDSLLKFAGGQGTRLHLTRKGNAWFEFARSARVQEYGTARRVPFALWMKYDRTLRLSHKITGYRKGTITLAAKSASGGATVHGRVERPAPYPLTKQSLAHLIKTGQADEALVPLRTTYTCSPKALTLRQQRKSPTGYVTTATWIYRR